MISALSARARRVWKNANAKKAPRVAIRIAKWSFGIVGGLWLLYIVAANAALRSQWARNKANADPQTLQVEYASAWTLIPGIVHMSKVTGFGQFTGLQYKGEIDHLRINIGMLALLRHHFVITIHAKGLALHGKPPTSTNPAAPVIDAPVALHPVAAPPVPVVDEGLAKWLIEVELEVAGGREVWVDAVRYAGPIEAHGSMTTTPNRSFAVKDFLVEIKGGTVVVGAKSALPRLAGRIDVKLDPVDPRAVDLGAFSRLTVKTTLEGSAADMSFVQDIRPVPVKFGGNGGDFAMEIRLEHGHLMAPGFVRVATDGIWAGFAGIGVRGGVQAEAVIEEAAGDPIVRMGAVVSHGAVTNAKGATMFTVPITTSQATTSHLDLADTKNMRFTFDAHAPRAVGPNADAMNDLIASPSVKVLKGAVTSSVDVKGEFPKGFVSGNVAFVTNDPLRLSADGITVQSTLTGKLPFTRADSTSDFVLSGTAIRAKETALDNGTSHTREWWGHAELPKGYVSFKGSPKYVGNIHAEFRDIDPVITAISKLHGVPEWVNKLLGIGPYNVDAVGSFGKDTKVDIVDARATARRFPTRPHTRVRASYDGVDIPNTWRTAIEFGVLAVGIDKKGDHLGIQLTNVSSWFSSGAPAGGGGGSPYDGVLAEGTID